MVDKYRPVPVLVLYIIGVYIPMHVEASFHYFFLLNPDTTTCIVFCLSQNSKVGLRRIFPVYNAIANAATFSNTTNTCPGCPGSLPIILDLRQAADELATLNVRSMLPDYPSMKGKAIELACRSQ